MSSLRADARTNADIDADLRRNRISVFRVSPRLVRKVSAPMRSSDVEESPDTRPSYLTAFGTKSKVYKAHNVKSHKLSTL